MKVAFACDHRGLALKRILMKYLNEKGHEAVDFGTYSFDSCDYPDYVYPACCAVRDRKVERAVVICYTGIGSAIVANKVRGIRAALVYNLHSAVFTRKHNDSNVLVLASNLFKRDYAKKVVAVWLKTEFEGGRHRRRLRKIRQVEDREC